MTVKGIADAGDLADHADLDHLRLDLAEAGDEAGDVAVGDEDAGGAQHRVDDVAGPQRELLDDAVGAGDDQGLVERRPAASAQRGLGARLLRGQLEVDLRLDDRLAGERGVDQALLRCRPATCARSTSRCEMASGLRRISSARVLNSSSACCSAPRACAIRPSASASCDCRDLHRRRRPRRSGAGRSRSPPPARCCRAGTAAGPAVDALVDVDEGLGDAAVGLGQDGDGAEDRDGARGRGVEVEDRGDQRRSSGSRRR